MTHPMNFEALASSAATNAADAAADLTTAVAGGLPCERHSYLIVATTRLATALALTIAAQAALNSRGTAEVLDELRGRLEESESRQGEMLLIADGLRSRLDALAAATERATPAAAEAAAAAGGDATKPHAP